MKVAENITSVTAHRKKRGAVTYRYGFNGKENDNEVKGGEGLQQDYGMRVYDNRLGKFLSVDPITKDYPWYTPYQFSGNNPIANIDLDGLEPLGSTESIGAQKTAAIVKTQSTYIFDAIQASTNTNFEQVYRYTQVSQNTAENEDNFNGLKSLRGRVRGVYGEGIASYLTITGLSQTFSVHVTASKTGFDVDISKKKTPINSSDNLNVGEASYAHQNMGFDYTVSFRTGNQTSADGKTEKKMVLFNMFQDATGGWDPETYSDDRTYTFGIEVKTYNPSNSSLNLLGYEDAINQIEMNFHKNGGMKNVGTLIPILQTDQEAWNNAYKRSPKRMQQVYDRLESLGGKLQLIVDLFSGSNSQMQQTKRKVNATP